MYDNTLYEVVDRRTALIVRHRCLHVGLSRCHKVTLPIFSYTKIVHFYYVRFPAPSPLPLFSFSMSHFSSYLFLSLLPFRSRVSPLCLRQGTDLLLHSHMSWCHLSFPLQHPGVSSPTLQPRIEICHPLVKPKKSLFRTLLFLSPKLSDYTTGR